MVLYHVILSGVIVGICFDFYRVLRWKMRFNKILTFSGDLFFSLIALLIIFNAAQKANFLEWRFYIFAGSLCGLILYLFLVSRFVTKLFHGLFELISRFFGFIIHSLKFVVHLILSIIACLMAVPYGILRWLGLLLFRMGESLGTASMTKVRLNFNKSPKGK